MTVFPGLFRGSSWSLLQEQESDNDTSPSENTKGIEIKEFEAEITSLTLPSLNSVLLSSQYGAHDSSFVRTFYSLVPTPPPDYVG